MTAAPPGTCQTDSRRCPHRRRSFPDGRLVLSYGMPHFPYGARAVVGSTPEDGAGTHWGDEVHVLALSRYAIREKARPVLAGAGVSAAIVVTADGAVVSAFHRGAALGSYAPTIYGPGMDEWGRRPAIGVVRWTPEGLEKPPLVYPNLWSDRVDARGYLDNGMVRMRPDDRYEGGDYVENFEMTAYRRVPAEHRYFAGAGGKGAVVCRHPDGSLVYSSRDCRIHRSTDEGRTWSFLAEIPLSGREPAVFGFGVTGAGTFLASYAAQIDEADPARGSFPTREPRVARSDDGGRTWTDSELAPRPTRYCGQGDGSRIVQLACGTVICFCSNAWNDAAHQAGYEGDVLLRSHDDGRSWGDWTVLPPGAASRTSWSCRRASCSARHASSASTCTRTCSTRPPSRAAATRPGRRPRSTGSDRAATRTRRSCSPETAATTGPPRSWSPACTWCPRTPWACRTAASC